MAQRRDTLLLGFGIDDDASPQLKRLSGNLEDVDLKSNMASAALSKGGGGAPGLIPALGPAGLAGGVAAAGAGLLALTAEYVKNTREANRNAEALRISIEEYSEWSFIMQQLGYDATDLHSILGELQNKQGELATGAPDIVDLYREIGLAWDDLKDKSPDEQLRLTATALADIENTSIRRSIADRLVGGDDAQRLLVIADNMDRLGDAAKRAGATISEESAAAAEELGRQIDNMEALLQAGKNAVAQEAVGFFGPIAENASLAFGLIEPAAAEGADAALRVFMEKREEALATGAAYGEAIRLGFSEELARMVQDGAATMDGFLNAIMQGFQNPDKTILDELMQFLPGGQLVNLRQYVEKDFLQRVTGIDPTSANDPRSRAQIEGMDGPRPGVSHSGNVWTSIRDSEAAQEAEAAEKLAAAAARAQAAFDARERQLMLEASAHGAGENLYDLFENVFGAGAGELAGFTPIERLVDQVLERQRGSSGTARQPDLLFADERPPIFGGYPRVGEEPDGGGGGRRYELAGERGGGGGIYIDIRVNVAPDGRERIEEIVTDAFHDNIIPSMTAALEEKGCAD